MSKFEKFLASVILLCSFTVTLTFAQVLGKVDYIEGSVELTRNGSVLSRVDMGTPIENMDLIKTSPNSTLIIAFSKESGLTGSVQIAPNSTALIRQDQLSASASNEVQLLSGSVNLKVKRLAGVNASVQVKTPSAVLGVRGTEFVVASFNGSALIACKEGEVTCYSYSSVTETKSVQSLSSVPGKLIEILENGSMNSAAFPEGDFEEAWDAVQTKWKNFKIDLVLSDPLKALDSFAKTWNTYASKLDAGASKLKANKSLSAWLSQGDKVQGSLGDIMKQKQAVVKDLIAIKGDMMMSIIAWYRIEELLPHIPDSAMNRTLSNGQTVKTFINKYTSSSKNVANTISLFRAAEKLYMLRNDGISPFSDF